VISSSLAALLLSAGPSSPVLMATPNTLGFEESELPALQQRLQGAAEGAGVVVSVVPAVAAECAADAACLGARVAEGAAIVVVDVSKIGTDIDVTDAVYGPGGTPLGGAHRTLPAAEFEVAPLSPEALAALAPFHAAPSSPPAEPPAPSSAPFPTKFLGVGAGALVGVAGIAGFAVEAATLEDPASLGDDKARARVTSWVFLGAAAAGVGGAVASALLWPDESPASSSSGP
jgi:hypothetical protein